MNKLLTITYLCGAVPIIVGTMVYFLSYLTHSHFLLNTGLVSLFVGIISVIVWLIMLTIELVGFFRRKDLAVSWGRVILGYLLLLLNFPVAWGLLPLYMDVAYSSMVRVVNRSSLVIQDVVLKYPGLGGEICHLGEIQAGKKKKSRLSIGGEGRVMFSLTIGTMTKTGVLFENIPLASGVAATLLIDENSDVTVHPVW